MKNILGSLPAPFAGCYSRYFGSLYANEALMQVILTLKIYSVH